MAKIVFGVGASHGPQMNLTAEKWELLRKKDEGDPRIPYKELFDKHGNHFEDRITLDKMTEAYEASHRAVAVLYEELEKANPDVIIMIGDDQHELFQQDNAPMFSIYTGATLTGMPHEHRENAPAWYKAQEDFPEIDSAVYPAYPELADHLLKSLIDAEFDMSVIEQIGDKPVHLGHAYMFLYQRLLKIGKKIPMVPIFINCFFPPNQGPTKRCLKLGQVVKQAVESFGKDQKVAIVFSGGLSHFVIDEELDWTVINGIKNKDYNSLTAIPADKLTQGSSEIRCWIASAAALTDLDLKVVDYVPAYRSLAGTGCGLAFVYWT